MRRRFVSLALVALVIPSALSAPYSTQWVAQNLNQNTNPNASVLDYSGSWSGHTYQASPVNWRSLPTYTVIPDRFLDGSPELNDVMGTMFEWDLNANQLRHGGDIQGLLSGNYRALDYIQGMGYGAIYLAGTPFINAPWGSDGYSPLDFTILDPHFGTIADWRALVTELHSRGMYLIIDFTVGTMGDMVGFEGYLNTSTPFSLAEHHAVWKPLTYGPISQYPDFTWNNVYNDSCVMPEFWNDDGTRVTTINQVGCYDSEFDQYGDTEAFGVHPDWQRELSKFASVQDRLREWKPSVAAKLQVFGCLIIEMLDVDGIRIDKATQMTVAALADWASTTRSCAAAHGKTNFYIPGEITGGNTFGSLYIGRGRTPDQVPSASLAPTVTANMSQYFLRDEGKQALDGAAFHYSIYRSLSRTLGMDGNLSVGYDVDVNFVNAWNVMLTTNDFVNPSTGAFDPRHLFGVMNQDVYRWPSLTNGTRKNLLGTFITTLMLPGIPLTYYGEEQEMYIYDSQAANYLFGRQPMGSNIAWQKHGCYSLGDSQYYEMPFNASKTGCNDDWNSLDHLDPTAPVRRVMSRMLYLRTRYDALLDGFSLNQLGNWTADGYLPGSNQTATTFGVWSVTRKALESQTLTGTNANVTVWMLYSNMNDTTAVAYDCTDTDAIISPYKGDVVVQNLLYPYDTITLANSSTSYYLDGNAPYKGCAASITLAPHAFAVYVPRANWVAALPVMTGFSPGHDARLLRPTVNATQIDLIFEYSQDMSCSSITNGLNISSELSNSTYVPVLDASSVVCGAATDPSPSNLTGVPPTVWYWSGTITNADDGVFLFSVSNATSTEGLSTGTTDHLLVRKGTAENIVVFPASTDANYYNPMIQLTADDQYTLTHQSLGASSFRWTTNYGESWSDWAAWESTTSLTGADFNASTLFDGKHIKVQYHSQLLASSAHVVEADFDWTGVGTRRFESFLVQGQYNDWGYDNGLPYQMERNEVGGWSIDVMMAWPTYLHILPIKGLTNLFYGDVDNDGILDQLQPTSQATNYVNITAPASPHLAYTIKIDEASMRWSIEPRGSAAVQIAIFFLLMLVPICTAIIAVVAYRKAFYTVTYNRVGVVAPKPFPSWFSALKNSRYKSELPISEMGMVEKKSPGPNMNAFGDNEVATTWPDDPTARRKVLIATLEYELLGIQPPVKVKIGGLGVMSSLMGKSMVDVDIIWVVPKVKDVEYPPFTPSDPVFVKIFDEEYAINLEIYEIDNVKYYILDSPVFRAQTKADPYPARMDDLESAIFYSTWNQCVAEVIRRTPNLSIYHINDYHATIAPLYLLPQIIPVCLSLHNAEFQGLWPLRTADEQTEVCKVFNLPHDVVEKYVQFGNTFNLLHAGAAYISVHQASTGVAGVSDKYGKRSWARYPALWTLKHIDSLPNPDPTDIEALDLTPLNAKSVKIDKAAEAKRPEFRLQAQRWAGLIEDPEADLFVFVGRWSKQKGVDLIADVFPSVLDKNPNVQLICVGPVIDLYGRFAAEKLARLMQIFPGRVFSKPEFTALPPFLFQGAEFALIPSRDEPFGLVAVEFGRKGALGVGSRLGGLGLAPGWWFNVESDSTAHMHSQFQKTIKAALKSTKRQRAVLRARSAVQRFPVLEWRQRTEDLHKRSILASRKAAKGLGMHWDGTIERNEPPTTHTYPPSSNEYPASPGLPPSSPGRSIYNPAPSYSSGPGTPMTGGELSPRAPLFGNNSDRRDSSGSSPRHPLQDGFSTEEDDSMAVGTVTDDYFGQVDEYDEANGAQSPPYGQSREPSDEGPGSFLARANTRLERQITRSRGKGRVRDPMFASDDGSGVSAPPSPSLRAPRKLFALASGNNSVDSLMDAAGDDEPLTAPSRAFDMDSRRQSSDSISAIMSEKSESPLNIALASFTDADGVVTRDFVAKMAELDPSNSLKDEYCVEAYLIRQEKVFFEHVRKEKRSAAKAAFRGEASTAEDMKSDFEYMRPGSPTSVYDEQPKRPVEVLPTRLQLWMLKDMWGWPIYTIILAIGQTLGASSFQLVLIGGSSTQSNSDLYAIGAVYLGATICWYILYSFRPIVYTLSLPFVGYAIAFLVVGLPSASTALQPWVIRHALTFSATCVYAFASAAGWAYFAFNFGEEAGVQTSSWVFRACVVQGTQQIWLAALWFWGFKLSGKDSQSSVPSIYILCATIPLCVFCLVLAYLTQMGLPGFYRQVPGHISNFVATLTRRKLVLWFLFSQILSVYWLSSPYGRNWQFLWQTAQLPTWVTVILAAGFFIGVWGFLLAFLAYKSKEHTWFLPIFAVGLGAPRWCQMLWGTSSIGLYLPWAGVAGPYISTCLWLWLGVLDSIQGVGLGMMLLQTLSRTHVAAALACAQVVGSVVTIVARASSPDKGGPGSVFPCFGLWNPSDGLTDSPFANWAFWFAMICQLVIVFGYLVLFRGEQLSKP